MELASEGSRFTVSFYTNPRVPADGTIKPGHAWDQGFVRVKASPAHGIKSGDAVRFNSVGQIQEAVQKALSAAGVTIHENSTELTL